jgi:hypothetical protein
MQRSAKMLVMAPLLAPSLVLARGGGGGRGPRRHPLGESARRPPSVSDGKGKGFRARPLRTFEGDGALRTP